MHISINSQLKYSVHEPGANPMIFVPEVDFSSLEEPSIIDAF